MWTCIGFLAYIFSTATIYDYKMIEVGSYANEQSCMVAGRKWVKKHGKGHVNADYVCEKQLNSEENKK